MEIEIESTLAINFFIDYFILKLTSLLFKERARFSFFICLVFSVLALIAPYFHLPSYAMLLIQLLSSLLIVSFSFGCKDIKSFGLKFLAFWGMTFVFGGACYSLSSNFGQLPIFIVAIVSLVVFLMSKIFIRARNKLRQIENFSFEVEINICGKSVVEKGYLDSGNMLYDPVTKKPVVLINFEVFNRFYDINYLNAYLKKINLEQIKDGHYIKINTVASGTQILAFSPDKVKIKGENFEKKYEDIMLGLTFSGFEKSFGRNVLLHSTMI